MSITREYAIQTQLWEYLMNSSYNMRRDLAGLVAMRELLPTQNLTESQRETLTKRINRYIGRIRS